MDKKEIQQEIEKVRLQLQTLEKKLVNGNNFGDEQVRHIIDDKAILYRNALVQSGGWKDIGLAFGEVVEIGEYKHRGLFLTNKFDKRDWEWWVLVDKNTNSEVLVRIDKEKGHVID
jgi:hypothetical protein